jgi:hypothetical protein
MVLLSTSNKKLPVSRFKNMYKAAKSLEIAWTPLFLPWSARPERTAEWYAERCALAMQTTGSLDDVHQEYPATDTEALAARTLDKRIPMPWIEQCFEEERSTSPSGKPTIDQLIVYRQPEVNKRYVIGGDPAEGNPTSDDSAMTVMDRETGEEVAVLHGKYQPAVFASHINKIGLYYNHADVLIERNNHGHAVILWLLDHSPLRVLDGLDDRPGWVSSVLGKTVLYDQLADAFREKQVILHSFLTHTQIASVEGATLRAPMGMMDDLSDSFAFANVARPLSMNADRAMQENTIVHDEAVRISQY